AVNVTVRSARPREYLTECEIDKLIDAACGAHHRRSLGIHSGLCGCEKFELPNFGTGLHRKPLFIRAHMCLTTEAHPVVAIYVPIDLSLCFRGRAMPAERGGQSVIGLDWCLIGHGSPHVARTGDAGTCALEHHSR